MGQVRLVGGDLEARIEVWVYGVGRSEDLSKVACASNVHSLGWCMRPMHKALKLGVVAFFFFWDSPMCYEPLHEVSFLSS